ncbi:hypothetical protein ACIRBX_24050 [Kitasatospora sp. NPDC096147]|uniref:hypothetical protein n=1 Tax=Kitasatospora sp. NPDC096147 TaxID=3364093 RepID=UPI00383024F7
MTGRWVWAAAAYVALVGVLAGLGGLREDTRCYLAAVVLTLPAGVAALVGVYVARGLLTGVGGLFARTTGPDGAEAGWLTAAGVVVNTVLFVLAAVATVLLLARLSRRRARPYPAAGRSAPGGPRRP